MFTREILLHLKLIEKQSRILFKKKAKPSKKKKIDPSFQKVSCVPQAVSKKHNG